MHGYCSFKVKFIEQVDSMIKGISKHNYHPSTPHNSIKLQISSADTCQQANLYQFIGNYPVQNWIIASRWVHMNWYLLGRLLSLLTRWIVRGVIDDICVFDLVILTKWFLQWLSWRQQYSSTSIFCQKLAGLVYHLTSMWLNYHQLASAHARHRELQHSTCNGYAFWLELDYAPRSDSCSRVPHTHAMVMLFG